ncbi:MAG: protein phosphatase 2C domain-containing protein [Bifidobacteriaceae bacterium]|jgi:protein phosphatase|nr:protein phosphatase 2C domain-containing protein [Bifidobacteriaceae bacterium]
MYFKTSAISDIGLSRKTNQDSAYISDNFILVADGMGGYAGGDLASKIVVDYLSKLNFSEDSQKDIKNQVGDILADAKITFGKLIGQNPNLNMMGSTITFLALQKNALLLGHVGDSRAYKFSGKKLEQLSKDHTVVQQLIDSGKLTSKKAKKSDSRHKLTRVFGFFDIQTNPDIELISIKEGDRYMVCSDGLNAFVSDKVIEKTLAKYESNDEACEKLVELAMRNGSTDNITVALATISEDENAKNASFKLGSAADENLQSPPNASSTHKTAEVKLSLEQPAVQAQNQPSKEQKVKSADNEVHEPKPENKDLKKPFWSIFG